MVDSPMEALDWAPANVVPPSWFLVGAEKAGTSSLHAYLGQHPQLLVSQVKEPHFYSFRMDHAARRGGEQYDFEWRRYLNRFRSDREVKAGDCSTSYLWHPLAATRIHEANPEARILVCLRDPVERAWSHYCMNRRMGLNVGVEAITDLAGEWVEHGLYGEQVARLLAVFGHEKVMVQFYEDFAANPRSVLADYARHLDVNPESVQHFDLSAKHNAHITPFNRWLKTGLPAVVAKHLLPEETRQKIGERLERMNKKPEMPEAIRHQLEDIFRPSMDALHRMEILPHRAPWAWY